jgi:hypothetical protein
MKIAVCLQGLSSGKNHIGHEVKFTNSYKYLKQNILDNNSVDIFLHTWNEDLNTIDEITNIYKPISSIFEKQIIFDENTKLHITKSRWYSHMKSVELKQQYEKENNIIYDFVVVTRFDNCFFIPFSFSEYDSNCFYSSNWDYPHNLIGFLDYWFLADSKTMDKFSNLYDKIDDYLTYIELSSHVLSKHHANKLNLIQKYIFNEHSDFGLERQLK